MKRILLVISILMAMVVCLLPGLPVASAAEPMNAPRIHVRDGNSTNWSGYAALPASGNGKFTDVIGSWTVPIVTGTSTVNTYSAAWVGIDGDGSNTVEQIGTSQDFTGGSAKYYAWYEMYPKFPVTLSNFAVNPTDMINAEVSTDGKGNFTLKMTSSTGASALIKQKSNTAKLKSAEWVMEAPSSSGGVLPLSSFGSINFAGASATYNGKAGNITTSSGKFDMINMVNSSGGAKATTTPTTDGTSFTVTFNSSN